MNTSGSPRPTAPPVVLDAAAGVPWHPDVRAAYLAAVEDGWADPDRRAAAPTRARALLDAAHAAVARVLGVAPDEVGFTPSGTVAAHAAVLGVATARARLDTAAPHPVRVLAAAVEHSAVLQAARHAVGRGGPGSDLALVAVDPRARVDPQAYAAAVTPATTLACLQSANHEVGTRQPVTEVAAACQAAGVPLLVDAGASLGHDDVPTGWDVLAAGARGWGGPPGVGVLAVRAGTRWRSPWPQDAARPAARHPGSTDLPAVVAAAVALELAVASRAAQDQYRRALVDRVRRRVAAEVPDVDVLGDPDDRAPHLLTVSCLYVSGEALLDALAREGLVVGSGSACSAASLEPSHVLAAMGALTHGNLRLALPPGTTEESVERLLAVLPRVVADLRREAGR